jgi:putative membrane protein
MILSLMLGIILGAISVIFALQNVTIVTVSFIDWQVTAPLALILLGTLLCGIVMTLLVLIPSLIRDEAYVRALKRQKRETEEELAKARIAAQADSSSSSVVERSIPA